MSTPRLLFVVGLARSGTTALAEVLSAHPAIVLGVERYKQLWRGERIDELHAGLFERERLFDLGDGLTNVTPERHPRWRAHYERMEAQLGQAAYVGDKMSTVRIQRLWKNLPDARLVCIVRDPRAVAESWEARARDPRDRYWPADNDARRAVTRWNQANRQILRAVDERPDRAVVIDHAGFFGAADPAPLVRLLDWLGLEPAAPATAQLHGARREYAEVLSRRPRRLSPDEEAYVLEHADLDRYGELVRRSVTPPRTS